ncbi:MAG: hypothetical protein J3R72DRAFT_451220 [Linnemannia gamsii]|nr:MAG: hypothetical protein J3R72DRAFT_451220 [Linnemannia gamsii]
MQTSEKPTVLIVGAGLGGLLLAALLEKSDVPYVVFERASTAKPLGSAMAVGPSLLPVFEQLGIYEEFLTISNPADELAYYEENTMQCQTADHRPLQELSGYGLRIVSRPAQHALFLKQIPAHKIHFGHRVLNITEDNEKVTIHLSNNETFEGDVVVGADGAYSAVRQRLYEQLKAKGELPESDTEELPFGYTCLVGQTEVLGAEQFPIIEEPKCRFNLVLGRDRPLTVVTFNTAQKTVCWMVIHYLSKQTSKAAIEQRFRKSENSEWGAYPAQTMCDETRDFPVQLGDGKERTLGDLYDCTPQDLISKVMLEEKVFDTWHHGRTVLLGDACHKVHPASGQGGVTAMHDAIALANLLYALPSSSSSDINQIFEEYRSERFPIVTQTFKDAQLAKKTIEKGIGGRMTLFLFTHMPQWLWLKVLANNFKARPQVGFLPAIENKGTVPAVDSPSFLKAKAAYENAHRPAVSV